MALQIDAVTHTCQTISQQVRDSFRPLTLHYIPHHDGQRTEALNLAEQEILYHPACHTARSLLSRGDATEESVLIGTAIARQNIFFGLSSRESALALCSMNIDQYETLSDARRHAYHLAWHAIDSLRYHEALRTKNDEPRDLIVRKRNALQLASANLRADVFAAVMAHLQGDAEAIDEIGLRRGQNALQPRSTHSPERYPFVMAIEATKITLAQLGKKTPLPKKKYIETALKIAAEVGKTFDGLSLKHWFAFSNPAQEMAWRGYNSRQILSAAINTSEDTYVRATGYLVAEITGIKPASVLDIRDSYSAFADDEFNKGLHEKTITQIFEDVIAQGIERNSIDPFIEMANAQNRRLTQGHFIGWCADALQDSALAFETARENGGDPAEAARRKFNSNKSKTPWETLKDISSQVIDCCRQGQIVTLSALGALCKDMAPAMALARSLDMTISDPALQQSLEAARDLSLQKPAHEAAPTAPAPAAPSPAMIPRVAPVAPGMGGVGGSGMMRSTPPYHQTHTEQSSEDQK